MNAFIGTCYNIAPGTAGIAEACKNLENCYYLENSPDATADGALFATVSKLTGDDMKSKGNFQGFDFDNVWKMGGKEYPYPVFRGKTY